MIKSKKGKEKGVKGMEAIHKIWFERELTNTDKRNEIRPSTPHLEERPMVPR